MDPDTQQAPPVVAVVVVHDPGPWFETTLAALAAQDYPNLRVLFLVAPGAVPVDEVQERISAVVPAAFVRPLAANVGFGPSANEVLRLVEGDNGLFLICHDDVAPDPGALRVLVEELYRSNAGAVGPKLVEWDEPRVLQSVGLSMDRFGEIDPVVEPGEVDQEQHDGVRDVFVLPSAYLLVRADLFRELGGFDPAIDYHGEDIELCWRIHHSGARVIVAPSARVRHLGALRDRRPDLPHGRLRARHRMRSVATLTGASRLPVRVLELVVLTLTELLIGPFTGRFGQAWKSLGALVGLLPRTPAIIARRRQVKPGRLVPEREVYSLQERGSARLNSYVRSRETTTYVGSGVEVRRWRPSTTAPVLAWIAVIIAVVVGGRSFFDGGIPAVGEFLPFPASPANLLETFMSGWNPSGSGATSPNPTGWAILVALSTTTLFHMGLLHTLFVLGLILVGVAGTWKLAGLFPSTRAQVGALVVYAATPLVSGAMSSGRLTVLVVYAAVPWIVHLLRRAVGISTADPLLSAADTVDGVVALDTIERVRRAVLAGLVVAVAASFAPVVIPLAFVIGLVLAVSTLAAGGPWTTAAWFAVTSTAATAVGALLNLPWLFSWSWAQLVGAPPVGAPGLGLRALASFEIGRTDFAGLSLALYLPVLAALLLAKAWRLTWAVRAGFLVVTFGALAVLGDRGSLPVDAPQAGVLLVPVALGVAISAAAALAAFDLDVRGGSFGWQQPLGILASMAVVVGIVPGLMAVADGAFGVPSTPLARLVDASLPDADETGDYNVLLVGDARLLPVPATEYRDGVSWAIIDDGELDARDRWAPPTNEASTLVTTALDEMASASTLRAGRLLAPLGVRFIVVPEFDGVSSTVNDPLPLPTGLVESLEEQLDLVARIPRLATLEVFENRAWLPTSALLQGAAAESSEAAGRETLVRSDLSEATPVFVGVDQFEAAVDDLEPGVVHLAVPFDDRWTLSVNGENIPARRAFGETTAFDVETGGVGRLQYDSPMTRLLLVFVQAALWIVALAVVSRIQLPTRRAGLVGTDEPIIDLSTEPLTDLEVAAAAVDPAAPVIAEEDR
ncbi:MAG TPA: glycosyltransferase [Ilumatobacteraceae bacterium]|nr:glycosyltransferase [Ilumatobacteraceae bacterium]